MTTSFDDGMWLSVGDWLGDEWVEDDTQGKALLNAARQRPPHSRVDGFAGVPRPRNTQETLALT